MSLRKNNYYLLSLGCSKNTVDSESIGQVLAQNGMRGVENPNRAEVLIVNTCGFIDAAKQESINALRELVEGKRLPVVQQRATTCDLCSSLDGKPSCVYACPHNAAFRMTGDELLRAVKNSATEV